MAKRLVDADTSDAKLDEAIEESFPASDPAANTVETGIRTGEEPADTVRDNRSHNQFEISANGEMAYLVYVRSADALTLVHTEVPPALRGRHLGDALVRAAVQSARSEGLRVIAVCPFAKAYLRKHSVA